MRKKESKLARNAITIFIVVLMVGSVVGYMFGSNSEENYEYNGHKFLRRGNKFVLKVNDVDVEFDYFPSDVESIELNSLILGKISGKPQIKATYDEDSKFKEAISVAQYDLDRFFNRVGVYFVKGLTSENDYGMEIVNCEDATSSIPVIYFKESNETRVFVENECIIAESNSLLGFIRIKDRLLYGLLGVIKDE